MAHHTAKKRELKPSAERRREIAEAALALVGAHGLTGTTVSRIAAAVGLSRGALYRHFRNREEVLEAAIDLLRERPSSWFDASSGDNALQRLATMGDRHAEWALSEFDTFVRPSFEFLARAAAENLTAQMGERQRDVVRVFCEMIDEGKREGSIRGDVDSKDIAWALMTFAWGEDVARLMGVEEAITEGASVRNLKRLLSCFAAERPCDPPTQPAPPAQDSTT